jgi:hypothetical protein
MNKSKALRLGGFTLAVGLTASLVGFAAHGTGAYFSAATTGTITGTAGHVNVTSGPSSLNFANTLPGVFTSQPVTYSVNGDGPEDVYLAFDTYPGDYAVNGFKSDTGPNGENALGRYGHLKISGPSGSFESNNLSTDVSQDPSAGGSGGRGTVNGDPTADCTINATTGLGGSSDMATRTADPANPGHGDISYLNSCPAPQYILLNKNLTHTAGTQTVNISFGLTQINDNNAGQGLALPNVPFRIVAEQAGVLPTDPNTTNGR